MSQPHKLAFNPAWLSEEEGAFTGLAKLAAANVLTTSALSPLLFGTKSPSIRNVHRAHQRCLLVNFWNQDVEAERRPLQWDAISRWTLDAFAGQWAKILGSEERMRFCPTCMRHGYQSSLCQIDAMVRCPAHRDLISDECLDCGGPTPPYTFEGATHNVFKCGLCNAASWGVKNPSALLKWRRMPGLQDYIQVAMRLAPLQRATFMDRESWDERFRHRAPQVKRIAEFNLLHRALHLRLPSECFTRQIAQVVVSRARMRSRETAVHVDISPRSRLVAYNSQLRLIRLSLGERSTTARRIAEVRTDQLPHSLEPEDFADSEVLAYCLFRLRFESDPRLLSESDVRARSIRPAILELMMRFGPDEQECRKFVAACYLADLSFCKMLRDRAEGFARGECTWHEVMEEHHRGFSARHLFLPYGLGILRVRYSSMTVAAFGFAAYTNDTFQGRAACKGSK